MAANPAGAVQPSQLPAVHEAVLSGKDSSPPDTVSDPNSDDRSSAAKVNHEDRQVVDLTAIDDNVDEPSVGSADRPAPDTHDSAQMDNAKNDGSQHPAPEADKEAKSSGHKAGPGKQGGIQTVKKRKRGPKQKPLPEDWPSTPLGRSNLAAIQVMDIEGKPSFDKNAPVQFPRQPLTKNSERRLDPGQWRFIRTT